MRPLILDIWQFYRSERLYLLQIVKAILSSSLTEEGAHLADAGVCEMLADIKPQLLDQLRAAVQERPPPAEGSEALGPALSRTCRRAWIHFNLREVRILHSATEIVQEMK